MNFLAHALVAGRTGSGSPERVVGAVLPDLAGMAGIRPVGGSLDGELAEGVACHHAADRAFHADRSFTAGARNLRLAALDAGLPPGASRVVGHLGWELLLDGTLLSFTDAAMAFEAALSGAPSATVAFTGSDSERWLALVQHLDANRWWLRYHDPEVVAEALHRRVRDRPRLAIHEPQVPMVARLLAGSLDTVDRSATKLVDSVVARVKSEGTAA